MRSCSSGSLVADLGAAEAWTSTPYPPGEPAAALRGHRRVVRVPVPVPSSAPDYISISTIAQRKRTHTFIGSALHPPSCPPRRGREKPSVRVALARPPSGRARRATRTGTATPATHHSTGTCLAGKQLFLQQPLTRRGRPEDQRTALHLALTPQRRTDAFAVALGGFRVVVVVVVLFPTPPPPSSLPPSVALTVVTIRRPTRRAAPFPFPLSLPRD
ncbi:hypothetical protein B0H17DRAFT_1338301 [Mycena rosella]|uniref:Uncharacterized protein n=1 Tax=Mycena rosella TaxID=1033263 RepID=A0AAD7CNA2_MYCRO|nr:hypothetical protein B0H17DRAFT_1338301 [Mycena rosella]